MAAQPLWEEPKLAKSCSRISACLRKARAREMVRSAETEPDALELCKRYAQQVSAEWILCAKAASLFE